MLVSRRKSFLSVLVGLAALSALGATSASALLPRFSASLRGTAESPTSFTLSGGTIGFHQESPYFQCRETKGTGSITGEKGGTVELVFKGCADSLGAECMNTATLGEIQSEAIPFVLAYTSKTSPVQVALVFNHKGGTFTAYKCGSASATTVRHAILSPIAPLNTVATSFTDTLEVTNLDEQTPTKNYTENNEAFENSFPEVQYGTGLWEAKFGLASKWSLGGLKHAGMAVEGSIEA
jgi:hypothetical protein